MTRAAIINIILEGTTTSMNTQDDAPLAQGSKYPSYENDQGTDELLSSWIRIVAVPLWF
jgi:hypothetical protein